MKKLKKIQENLPIIFIAIAMLLILVNDSDSKQIDIHLEMIIITLFFIAISMELYQDIKSRKYSTAILIIVVDVIQIVAFIALCYFNYKSIDKANNDLLWKKAENMRHSAYIMILMPSIRMVLKSQRFEKNITS